MKKAFCIAALVTTQVVMAATVTKNFEPCEKTYVDPFTIDLDDNKIKVPGESGVFQTSAIYSDGNGLYYKDYMHEMTELHDKIEINLSDLFSEGFFPIQTDERLSMLEENDTLFDPFESLVTAIISQEEKGPSSPPPNPSPTPTPAPKPKQLEWPFSTKRH